MMTRISRFTPWLTPKDQLEAIFVARQSLLDDLVERAEQTTASPARNHTLLVGPRGAGKTHLLAMLYHRLQEAIAAGLTLQVARLPEDPYTIVSYPRLLAAIVAAVAEPARGSADDLEFRIDRLAQEKGPIVVFVENLDEVFTQIGVDGQRSLRHYLQTSPGLLLMATTTTLDRSLTQQTSPFYAFFSTVRLKPLTIDHAQELLVKLASQRADPELAESLSGGQARGRLEMVRQLAGSEPRVWATFSDVMTAAGLQRVADLLYASFDDLTPYYQDRLRSLTAQQRLVVAELAEADHPVHVQELAKGADLPPRSVARTVGELRELGWVVPVTTPWDSLLDKRRSYYELAEPLTRLAFQVKDAVARPIELIVNFLSVWFDPAEVSQWSGGGLMESYALEVDSAFGKDSALRLVRRLTRLPDCKADDIALLGRADDALAALRAGDAEPIMALPSMVRAALERRCKGAANPDEGIAEVRRELHQAALDYMGNTPREPQSGQWAARAEQLAGSSHEAKDLSLWAQWLAQGWRFDEALAVIDLLIGEHESTVLGPDHPDTLMLRDGLARAYESAGRLGVAIPLFEANLADMERVLGADHPDTLTSRNNLAVAHESAGRLDDAIPLYEDNLADSVRVLGLDHSGTLTSRNNLAHAYESAGRLDYAIPLYAVNLADRERVLGTDHPDTLISRNNLAAACTSAGRLGDAIPLFEATLADMERVLGPDHRGTLTARDNLAAAYGSAGRLGDAIPLHEATLADRERVLGPDHPDTLRSRHNLAAAYRSAGRLGDAIPLHEATLADRERVLGPDHPDTLRSRHNLAYAYKAAGREDDAISEWEKAVSVAVRVLGEEHPDTTLFRSDLEQARLRRA
jgi:tetratricopeptide (TPR) repeat protein